jgi:hypothetical protein
LAVPAVCQQFCERVHAIIEHPPRPP